MKIIFELNVENDNEDKVKYQFMNLVVKDLKDLLYGHIDELNLDKVGKAIVNNNQIAWKTKTRPKEVNSKNVVIEIIKSIKVYEHKNNIFIIQLDKNKNLSNTNTSIGFVARLVEYGSQSTLPLHFFSKYFNEFANKSRLYWSSYKQLKTQIKVKEIVTVE